MRVLRFNKLVLHNNQNEGSNLDGTYIDLDSTEIPALRAIINAVAFRNSRSYDASKWTCGSTIHQDALQELVPDVREFLSLITTEKVTISKEIKKMLEVAKTAIESFLEEYSLDLNLDGGVTSVSNEVYTALQDGLFPIDILWEQDSDYLLIGGMDINSKDLRDLLKFLENCPQGVLMEETDDDEEEEEEEEDEDEF